MTKNVNKNILNNNNFRITKPEIINKKIKGLYEKELKAKRKTEKRGISKHIWFIERKNLNKYKPTNKVRFLPISKVNKYRNSTTHKIKVKHTCRKFMKVQNNAVINKSKYK